MICVLALATGAMAQPTVVYTDPVGFVTVTVPAQSDAVLAVPMQRTAVFRGTVLSKSVNQVTLSSAPTLPVGTVCALVLASGAEEGLVAKIASQNGAILTLTLAVGDSLSAVIAGDKVKIIPYWTPASLFATTVPVGLQVLGFEAAGPGINLSSTKVLVHEGSGAWENGVTGQNASAEPLPFGSAIVVRNPSGSVLSVPIVGAVPMNKHRVNLATLAASTPQDVRIGYGSPIFETLDNVGLNGAAVGDKILAFDNTATGINKQPVLTLVREAGAWVDETDNTHTPVGPTFQFTPGFGYVFRKAATSPNPETMVWSDLPAYLPLAP